MSKPLYVLLGSCPHDRYAFPMRVQPRQCRSEAAGVTGTYVVCLDCGKKLAYSWDEMKVVSASSRVKPRRTTFPTLRQKSQRVEYLELNYARPRC